MERMEIVKNIALEAEKQRIKLGYSQTEMAKALDVSLSTYKRIISGQTDKIDAYFVYMLYKVSNCFFLEMIGENTPFIPTIKKLQSVSERQFSFIDAILDFEMLFAETGKKNAVSVLVPTSDTEDGMIWDSARIEKVETSHTNVSCGIKITSNHFNPVYVKGDIILISKRPIKDGDVGIFINKETRRAYIRKMEKSNPCYLHPLNEYGETFVVDSDKAEDVNKWIKFGVVVSKVR